MKLVLGSHARVGKDSVADILCQKSPWDRFAFASPVHAAVREFKECIGDTTDEKYRDGMIAMAERARAVHGPDIFINILLKKVGDGDTVVTDMRKKVEYEALKARGFHYVRVLRPGVDPLPSETELLDVVPDYTIVNDGTLEDLKVKVDQMLLHFG